MVALSVLRSLSAGPIDLITFLAIRLILIFFKRLSLKDMPWSLFESEHYDLVFHYFHAGSRYYNVAYISCYVNKAGGDMNGKNLQMRGQN